MLVQVAHGPLKTKYGDFVEHLFYDGTRDCIALVYGDVAGQEGVLCRVHSQCLTAHLFNSIECDCREQMAMAQQRIRKAGRGLIIWLDQDGRGNGHFALLKSAHLRIVDGMSQTEAYTHLGFPTESRTYRQAREVLNLLKVKSISLLSNSPQKRDELVNSGIVIDRMFPIYIRKPRNDVLSRTYEDKKSRGHAIRVGASAAKAKR
jgi:GTP cyclohydrolase II